MDTLTKGTVITSIIYGEDDKETAEGLIFEIKTKYPDAVIKPEIVYDNGNCRTVIVMRDRNKQPDDNRNHRIEGNQNSYSSDDRNRTSNGNRNRNRKPFDKWYHENHEQG